MLVYCITKERAYAIIYLIIKRQPVPIRTTKKGAPRDPVSLKILAAVANSGTLSIKPVYVALFAL